MLKCLFYNKLHESHSKGQPGSSEKGSMKSVLEMIHINAFNTLPIFAFATVCLGELKPVVQSEAIRGNLLVYIHNLSNTIINLIFISIRE